MESLSKGELMKNSKYKNCFQWILIILLFGTAFELKASPGDLDTTFRGTGKSRIGFGLSGEGGTAVAIQADNKILVAGRFQTETEFDSVLIRYNADGSLDNSFGIGGQAITTSATFRPYSIAIQADGKIVLAGDARINGDLQFAVGRYNADGSPDTSLDGDGMVITAVSQLGPTFFSRSEAAAVGVLSDGKIVAAGYAFRDDGYDFAVVRYNANGSLDTSFGGGDGIVITKIGNSNSYANVLGFQSGGKFIAAGSSKGDFALVRYNSNGSLDTTFSDDGIVTRDLLGSDAVNAIVFQGNTSVIANPQPVKIIVAGTTGMLRFNSADGSLDTTFGNGFLLTRNINNTGASIQTNIGKPSTIIVTGSGINPLTGSEDFTVSRYLLNGSLDTAFGHNGIIYTPVGTNTGDTSAAMRVSSGKIVVTGTARFSDGGHTINNDLAVVRYNIGNGSLDTTFDGDGKRIDEFGNLNSSAQGVALQPDGKIIVAGYADTSLDLDFAVMRYNADGTLDTSFGGDGKVTTDIKGDDIGNAVAIQADGKIVVAGSSGVAETGVPETITVVRYKPDGTLDTSFNSNGRVRTSVSATSAANAIAIQPDGRIVVAGVSVDGLGRREFAVVRYRSDGSLDSSFDSDGRVITGVGLSGDSARAVKIQDDKIIVAGNTKRFGVDINFAVVRYNANGSLDNSFGSFGKVVTDFGGGFDDCFGMAIQTDGKIILTGSAVINSSQTVAVVRYLNNGSLDFSFDGDGKVTTLVGTSAQGRAVAIETSGRIVVAGRAHSVGSGDDFAVVRYNPNGSLDKSYGTGGKVVVDFFLNSNDTGNSVILDLSGRAIVAGVVRGLFGTIRLQSDVVAKRTPFDFDGDRTEIDIFRNVRLKPKSQYIRASHDVRRESLTPALVAKPIDRA